MSLSWAAPQSPQAPQSPAPRGAITHHTTCSSPHLQPPTYLSPGIQSAALTGMTRLPPVSPLPCVGVLQSPGQRWRYGEMVTTTKYVCLLQNIPSQYCLLTFWATPQNSLTLSLNRNIYIRHRTVQCLVMNITEVIGKLPLTLSLKYSTHLCISNMQGSQY